MALVMQPKIAVFQAKIEVYRTLALKVLTVKHKISLALFVLVLVCVVFVCH